MIYVALAALALVVAEGLAFARILQTVLRAHARREDLLVNQLCALAGKPWEPPPAQQWQPPDEDEPTLYASPEQMTAEDLDPVI